MAVIPEGYAEVVARIDVDGAAHEVNCVFGIQAVSALNQADADLISSAAASFFRDNMTTSAEYLGVVISEEQGDGPIIWESFEDAGIGVQTDSAVPPQVSALLRKATGSGGRKSRGRLFFPSVEETQVSAGGVLSDPLKASLDASAVTLGAALGANSTPMVLLHSTATFPPYLVTSIVTDSRVATQRRRLRD